MTPEQLQAIEDRWAKATKGSWYTQYGEDGPTEDGQRYWNGEIYISSKENVMPYHQDAYIATVGYNGSGENDAQAIAHAPTDVQDLLAEVRRLRGDGGEGGTDIIKESSLSDAAYVGML